MALFLECMPTCARNCLTPPTLSETRCIATHELKGIGKTLLTYNAGDRFGVQTLRNQ